MNRTSQKTNDEVARLYTKNLAEVGDELFSRVANMAVIKTREGFLTEESLAHVDPMNFLSDWP